MNLTEWRLRKYQVHRNEVQYMEMTDYGPYPVKYYHCASECSFVEVGIV